MGRVGGLDGFGPKVNKGGVPLSYISFTLMCKTGSLS